MHPGPSASPNTVQGHAQYKGTDTKLKLSHDPLLSLKAIEARSNDVDGQLVSAVSVTGLRLAAGVLSVDVVKARCTADGTTVGLSAPQAALETSAPLSGTGEVEAGSTDSIPGVGSVSFEQQDRREGEGSVCNIVLEVDTDLRSRPRGRSRTRPGGSRTRCTRSSPISASTRRGSCSRRSGDATALTGEPLYSALEEVVNSYRRTRCRRSCATWTVSPTSRARSRSRRDLRAGDGRAARTRPAARA